MKRTNKIALTEKIIEKFLKRYESEAIDMIESIYCTRCPYRTEECSPCEEMYGLILQTEEYIASKNGGLN